MSGSRIPVSLSEVLEVRSSGLDEIEAWSVLGQGLEPLERLIENAKRSSVGCTGLSPDSMFFLHDGSVQLKVWPLHSLSDSLIPPEYGPLLNNDLDLMGGGGAPNGIDLDKGSAASSPELYSVLNLMTLAEPNARMPLAKIAQIVHNQLNQRAIDSSVGIQNLYRLIMGSNDDLSDLGFAESSPEPMLAVDTNAVSPLSTIESVPSERPSTATSTTSERKDFVEHEAARSPTLEFESRRDELDKSMKELLDLRPAGGDFTLEYEKGESKLIESTNSDETRMEMDHHDSNNLADVGSRETVKIDETDSPKPPIKTTTDPFESKSPKRLHQPQIFVFDETPTERVESTFQVRLGSSPTSKDLRDIAVEEHSITNRDASTNSLNPIIDTVRDARLESTAFQEKPAKRETQGYLLMEESTITTTTIRSTTKSEAVSNSRAMYADLSSEDDEDKVFVDEKLDVPQELDSTWKDLSKTDGWSKLGGQSRKESEMLLLSEMESPIGHSTALGHPIEEELTKEHPTTTTASLISPSDDEWSKKPSWVVFDGDSKSKTATETDPDLFWMDQASSKKETEPSTMDSGDITTTTGAVASSKTMDVFSTSASSDDLDDSVFGRSNAHHHHQAQPLPKPPPQEQPTFYRDPFSFEAQERRTVSALSNMEDINFGLAFQSDPTSPEKAANTAATGGRPNSHLDDTLLHDESSNRNSIMSESGKLRILEKLMPTASSTFTNPKDHGNLESVRSHHSVDCAFCSPERKSGGGEKKNEMGEFGGGRCSLHTIEADGEGDFRSGVGGGHLQHHNAKKLMAVSDEEDSTTVDMSSMRKSPYSGLLLSSPSNKHHQDSLFASFDNLSSSTVTNNQPPSEETKQQSRPSSTDSLDVRELHYDQDDSLTPQKYTEFEDIPISDGSPSIPPPRPPRRADTSMAAVAIAEPTYDPFQKVELYTKRTSKPTSPVRTGAGGFAHQEKSVPVLGVHAAMRKRSHESMVPPMTNPIDEQQPFSYKLEDSELEMDEANKAFAGHELGSIPEGTNEVSATAAAGAPSTSSAEATISQHPPQVYRNPSFVRSSISRSARRHPSQRGQQKQQRPKANGKDSTMSGTGPEFLYKSCLPSIRLKAPSAKRKKLFRSSPDVVVIVILLNGQRVDVECHADSTADDVFQAVSAHTNVMESHFFGLTYMKDGEHYFLEPEQKLSKYAPSGWRNTNNNNKDLTNAKFLYTLYFRLKFYPAVLEFVKTEQTRHQIYLQLRRDVIDDRLQCNRDESFALAAVALQAEYGDAPADSNTYFEPDFYLPPDIASMDGQEQRIRGILKELQGQHGGAPRLEAEMDYIRMCQSKREYGIHFHRIYRTKPSSLLTPSPLGDPDTGTPLWIGIMPRGIVVFEERGGERVPISQHPWNDTQTLQFDHKRFVIVPQMTTSSDPSRNPPRRLVFFTDNYRKSCYFVRFAAAQHRFCMRQRFWIGQQETLRSNGNGTMGSLERGMMGAGPGGVKRPANLQVPIYSSQSQRSSGTDPDSGFSREASPDAREPNKIVIAGEVHQERAVDPPRPPGHRKPVTPGQNNGTLHRPVPPSSAIEHAEESGVFAKVPMHGHHAKGANGTPKLDVFIPDSDISKLGSLDGTLSVSMERRLDEGSVDPPSLSPSDYQTFAVKLYKDPQMGLGLTLVDGEIQGIKGVYVKSLTSGGPAELEGRVRIGDKITSINGHELESKGRYEAVQYVRESQGDVELGILRLRSLYSSNESLGTGSGSGDHARSRQNSHEPPRIHGADTSLFGVLDHNRKAKTLDNRHHHTGIMNNSNSLDTSKMRKLSTPDEKFGVPSDYLPDTSDVDQFLKEYEPPAYGTKAGALVFVKDTDGRTSAKLYTGLQHEESDAEDNRSDAERSDATQDSEKAKHRNQTDGKKKNARRSSSDVEDEADADETDRYRTFGDGGFLKIDKKASSKSHGDLSTENTTANLDDTRRHGGNGSRGDIDWTNDLINSRGSSVDSLDDTPPEDLQLYEVELAKNDQGSLGIQVAGGKNAKKVYVKALVAEPALSCPEILPGDQLASVNGVSTLGMSHTDVVSMLKNATSPVHLGLLRPKSTSSSSNGRIVGMKENANVEANKAVETLEVTLEKPSSGSLGMSLAKPRTGAGIYVRHINPNSVAAVDGRLKEGDRLWKINGELVAQSTPEEVVEKLKAAQGYVHLVIRRELGGQ